MLTPVIERYQRAIAASTDACSSRLRRPASIADRSVRLRRPNVKTSSSTLALPPRRLPVSGLAFGAAPETSPELAVWRGSSNTVSRALSLIDAGALDDGNVDALALCLGMGDRQLRRLFRSHLGATPIAVAQTRRVLLAKQLLHETRLPMSEVALASGFGSVRRFNEVFQTLFDRPPGALRRLTGEVAADVDGIRLELPYRTPFDWEGLISYLSFRAIKGVEVVSPERYARAIALDGEVGLLMVEPGRKSTLSVTIRFPKLSALHRIIARVRHIFDLTADPEAITEHLSRDPALAPRVAARPGLRVPGAWDGFELTVRAILGHRSLW